LFPSEQPLPEDRTDVVMLPDLGNQRRLIAILSEGESAEVYVEGRISGMSECFQEPREDLEVICTPYRRPLDLRVTRLELPQE